MNFKRKKPRIKGSHGKSRGKWLNHWPSWWTREFLTRPFKRAERRYEKDILTGRIDPEETLPEKTTKKPHKYYW